MKSKGTRGEILDAIFLGFGLSPSCRKVQKGLNKHQGKTPAQTMFSMHGIREEHLSMMNRFSITFGLTATRFLSSDTFLNQNASQKHSNQGGILGALDTKDSSSQGKKQHIFETRSIMLWGNKNVVIVSLATKMGPQFVFCVGFLREGHL